MMRHLTFFVAIVYLFGFEPTSRGLGLLPAVVALVLAGVALAVAVSGTHALSVATGAAGALAFGLLGPFSAGAAGAAVALAAYAERSVRVRDRSARALHVVLAGCGGAAAGVVAATYAGAGLVVQAVVVVVAAVLIAAPRLIEADDPVAHGLSALADALPEDVGARLRDGAELRRAGGEETLDVDARRHAEETWKGLLALAQSRVRLERKHPATAEQRAHGEALRRRLDERIDAHVTALGRIFYAVDEARAAEVSLDDTALRRVESKGASLEEVSRAIIEV
ncbi:MAG: hypothetical protein AAF928_00780 [Myxococcota bacterium]